MLLAALRDMQWRKRRFVIAILSTAIIFAMTLVLTGLANGFRAEAQRTVDALGVDVFLVKDGASGPFVGATPFAPADLRRIAAAPGVQAAAPLVYAGGTVTLGEATRNADLFGAPERGPGMPVLSEGRPPANPNEVAVSSTLGRNVGEDIEIASRKLRIVGIVRELHRTGQPAQHLSHHRGCPTAGVRRATVGRVDRDSRQPRPGAARIQSHRPRRRGRRSAPPTEGGRQLHHDRGDPALGRRGPDRGIGDLSVRAGTHPRLRGVQGDRRTDPFDRGRTGAAGGGGRHCPPSSSASCFRRCSGRSFRCRSSSRATPTSSLPVIAVVFGLIASVTGLHRAVSVDPAMAFGGP